MSKRTRRRRTDSAGLWLLEVVAITGFISLLMFARNERDAASVASESVRVSQLEFDDSTVAGWQQHRPRFTQVMADIWNAGF